MTKKGFDNFEDVVGHRALENKEKKGFKNLTEKLEGTFPEWGIGTSWWSQKNHHPRGLR